MKARLWLCAGATALCAAASGAAMAADAIPITVSAGVRDPIDTHLYVALAKGRRREPGV